MVGRLVVCVLLTALLLTTSFADAQQPKKAPRIGFLGGSSASAYSSFVDSFRQGLRELGWVEGENIAFEYRYAQGNLIGSPTSRRSWSVTRLMSLLCRGEERPLR